MRWKVVLRARQKAAACSVPAETGLSRAHDFARLARRRQLDANQGFKLPEQVLHQPQSVRSLLQVRLAAEKKLAYAIDQAARTLERDIQRVVSMHVFLKLGQVRWLQRRPQSGIQVAMWAHTVRLSIIAIRFLALGSGSVVTIISMDPMPILLVAILRPVINGVLSHVEASGAHRSSRERRIRALCSLAIRQRPTRTADAGRKGCEPMRRDPHRLSSVHLFVGLVVATLILCSPVHY